MTNTPRRSIILIWIKITETAALLKSRSFVKNKKDNIVLQELGWSSAGVQAEPEGEHCQLQSLTHVFLAINGAFSHFTGRHDGLSTFNGTCVSNIINQDSRKLLSKAMSNHSEVASWTVFSVSVYISVFRPNFTTLSPTLPTVTTNQFK